MASLLGFTEIVKILLKDDRIDPTVFDNEAIRWAVQRGNYDIVEILIKDKRVFDKLNKEGKLKNFS